MKNEIKKKYAKFILKHLLLPCVALVLLAPFHLISYGSVNHNQIEDYGGDNTSVWESDGVSASKIISETDEEDYFDITLKVKSKETVEQIFQHENAAVVLVMDLSNTMKSSINGGDSTFGDGSSKAELAISSAQNFVSNFYENALSFVTDEIGVVGFNTSGVMIQPLTPLDSDATVNSINSNISNSIMTLLNSYAASGEARRYTNLEAGLKMAKTMMDGTQAKYKYIILLSDGLPTTYTITTADTDYEGQDPSTMTSKVMKSLLSSNSSYYTTFAGTNYSDKGAKRARQKATELKNAGVKIFSVGVGLTFGGSVSTATNQYEYGNQAELNGQELIINQLSRATIARVSTIEDNLTYTWDNHGYSVANVQGRTNIWNANKQALYALHWEICRFYNASTSSYSYLPLNSDQELFKNWLKYSIGSGYYYNAEENNEIQAAVDEILYEINNNLITRSSEVWTTDDPMSSYDDTDSTLLDYIEFQGFYDKNNNLVNSLSGTNGEGSENTVSLITENVAGGGKIKWDLKNSGYTTATEEGSTIYVYQVKYRIRLKTEKDGFVSEKLYDSNGRTTLTYVIKDNQGNISQNRVIDFPIPIVKGYLGSIKIRKRIEGIASNQALTELSTTFNFHITLTDSNNVPMTNTISYNKYNADDTIKEENVTMSGSESFTLEDGEYVIISSIPHGTKYTIVEDEQEGFVSTIGSGDASGTITTDSDYVEVEFVNKVYDVQILKQDQDDHSPLGNVSFSLYQRYEDGSYQDLVTNLNGNVLSEIKTGNDGVVDLGNLSYPMDGEATYYLKEEESLNGYLTIENPIIIKISNLGVRASYLENELSVDNVENSSTIFRIVVANEKDPSIVEPDPTDPEPVDPVEPEPTDPTDPEPVDPEPANPEPKVDNNPRTKDSILIDIMLFFACIVWFVIGLIQLKRDLKNVE